MRMAAWLGAIAFLGFPVIAAAGVVINVPADYATIQEAVDNSLVGDTIIVAPGQYTEWVELQEDHVPSIVSTDPDDPAIVESTTIQGGIALLSSYDMGGTIRISGLTIVGGGILANSYNPTGTTIISDNIITLASTGVLVDCGCEMEIRIINNTIMDNIYGIQSISTCNAVVYAMDNDVSWNDVGIDGAFFEVSGNTIEYNFDGGVMLWGAGEFGGNYVAHNLGTGVDITSVEPWSVHNNHIVNNDAGLMLGEQTAADNNTIVANDGFGLGLPGAGSEIVRNSIIFANGTAVSYPSGTPNITYCCSNETVSGTGNFVADPLFVNPASGDYHLTEASPCINRGTPDYDWTISAVDYDGDLRVFGGRVDVGADETSVAAPPVLGDLNGDGVVDELDIQILVNILLNE